MKQPYLSTFVSRVDDISSLLAAGATELIIDHPTVSARSWQPDPTIPFDGLESLITACLAHPSQPAIVINCDIICHESHWALIDQLISIMTTHQLSTIRIQDMGLAYYLYDKYPDLTLHYAAELGNQNAESVALFSDIVDSQYMSCECSHTAIQTFQSRVPNLSCDVMVQGPILIQYSKRQYLAGLANKDSSFDASKPYYAQDNQYPQRHYIFYENQHGHFMYGYFDRSLLRFLPELIALKCRSWLIDGRSQQLGYTLTSLALYQSAMATYQKSPQDWQFNPAELAPLQKFAERAQKPGFFGANHTDQVRKNHHQQCPSGWEYVGTVIDILNGDCFTVEMHESVTIGDSVVVRSPRQKDHFFTVESMTTTQGIDINSTVCDQLVCFGWKKGVEPKSRLYRILD